MTKARLLLLSLLAIPLGTACGASQDTGDAPHEAHAPIEAGAWTAELAMERLPDLSVEAVASATRAGSLLAVDCNREATRREFGVVPGALLIDAPRSMDVDLLPPSRDAALVFYCSGPTCMAAPAAAAIALNAGYHDVSVMRAGIRGWVGAGEPVEAIAVESQEAAEVNAVTVEEAAALFASREAVAIDVNSTSTRQEFGVVPGATLLSSVHGFEATELPDDRGAALVFYCGSPQCTAAPEAAARAMTFGFTNVHVMTAGIRGWTSAGLDVSPAP